MNSALYLGFVRHRRYFPAAHHFRYPIFMSWLDLDELDYVFNGRWFWSSTGRNIAEFRRDDFLGPSNKALKTAVLDRVYESTGERPEGKVYLLTHLRFWGLSFNPVSFYYCYHADNQRLHSIVAEITNTPWKERFAYVLPVASAKQHGSAWHWDFAKQFHVSPFLPMAMHYNWRFQDPRDNLRVHMDVYKCDGTAIGPRQFDSTLVLGRREMTSMNLAKALLRFPFITLGVLWKIYWQALLLKLKRSPFYDHPNLS